MPSLNLSSVLLATWLQDLFCDGPFQKGFCKYVYLLPALIKGCSSSQTFSEVKIRSSVTLRWRKHDGWNSDSKNKPVVAVRQFLTLEVRESRLWRMWRKFMGYCGS